MQKAMLLKAAWTEKLYIQDRLPLRLLPFLWLLVRGVLILP